jgi:hypothetical protein
MLSFIVAGLRYKPEGRGFDVGVIAIFYLHKPAEQWPWGRQSL